MFYGNTLSFSPIIVLRIRSRVVAGVSPLSAAHLIGLGGFSSFFLGAAFYFFAFLPSSFFLSFGMSFPKFILIGSL